MKTEIKLELIELERHSYHLLLNAKINDHPIRMVLDTGASRSCFDLDFLKQKNIVEIPQENEIQSSGLGGSIGESMIANVDKFQIGDFTICDYTVIGLDLSSVNQAYSLVDIPPIQGILGGDILKLFGSVIKYDKKTLVLKTRRPNPDAIYIK
ncbi:MAG: retropepsin-like aspartic protease [Bacteroidales bacterium]|nr:retropepsin-like aspartic protease [Bacteroidales bacterium]MDY0216095.1 retropepsin-like aspartic protease [Bacteroidales bacterium]